MTRTSKRLAKKHQPSKEDVELFWNFIQKTNRKPNTYKPITHRGRTHFNLRSGRKRVINKQTI